MSEDICFQKCADLPQCLHSLSGYGSFNFTTSWVILAGDEITEITVTEVNDCIRSGQPFV
ncbi:hypothetical protein HGO23_14415 [Xenorhabdus budapestensis]|uniref:Apple domain-containing protein n=1 Tax=Xenorhabdus budapestensis TaxID=290110 RepID=A0ABX7VE01_XENBU|nr:hypothetical protein [Xenorhabdus budapestensis]QTL39041.1 hypothetical protein HGO23_14415 [Xenorhabdus budapestensis]